MKQVAATVYLGSSCFLFGSPEVSSQKQHDILLVFHFCYAKCGHFLLFTVRVSPMKVMAVFFLSFVLSFFLTFFHKAFGFTRLAKNAESKTKYFIL
jgi:hypothetical protein